MDVISIGELVGFSSLSKSTTQVASAQVVEAGEAFVIDERDFRALMASRPALKAKEAGNSRSLFWAPMAAGGWLLVTDLSALALG